MYSPRMRSGSRFILLLACVSFLTMTLSGFHLHVDFGEHDEFVSHAHELHQSLTDDLDDGGDHIDISVFEPARGFSKVEAFVPCIAVPELAALPPLDNHWSTDAPSPAPQRHLRLRPALRAPPLYA